MKIFLDNIRGFHNCYVDLNQVNFLVGENSTGKSSFLSIISLLSDPQFPLSGEFKNSYINFGLFDEIVSKKSQTDPIAFYIGISKEKVDNTLSKPFLFDCLFLKYTEDAGYPGLARAYCRAKNSILIFDIEEKQIKYNLIVHDPKTLPSDKELFFLWKNGGGAEKVIDSGSLAIRASNRANLISYILNIAFRLPYLFSLKENERKNKIQLYKDFMSREFRGFSLERDALLSETVWIAPIRSKPERIYTPSDKQYSPEGEHIPTILRDIFEVKYSMESKKLIRLLESFGKASGLFDKISIDKYKRAQKNSPFDINVILHGNKLKISNVGYGVSQILPILTEVGRRQEGTVFLIQQPEVHLHPRSQAFFGEFIFEQFYSEKKSFYIETHSDFIIDRFRKHINNKTHKEASILFFETKGNSNTVHRIDLDRNGEYIKPPKSFRDFFLKEQLSLLGF